MPLPGDAENRELRTENRESCMLPGWSPDDDAACCSPLSSYCSPFAAPVPHLVAGIRLVQRRRGDCRRRGFKGGQKICAMCISGSIRTPWRAGLEPAPASAVRRSGQNSRLPIATPENASLLKRSVRP